MLRTLVVIAAVLASAYSYTPCLNVRSAPIDEKWFAKVGAAGMHIPLHSRCNNCENEENWKWVKNEPQPAAQPNQLPAPARRRRSPADDTVYCWSMVGITQLTATGVVALTYQCEPRGKIEHQYCAGTIPKVKVEGVSFSGANTMTITDNSTYVAGVTCMFGRENFWWMAFTTPEAPAEHIKTIEDHFKSLGFTAVTAIVANHAPLILQSLSMTEC